MNHYPGKNRGVGSVKLLINLAVLAAVIFFIAKIFITTSRMVHIVNESGVSAVVLIPGQHRIPVAHGFRKTLKIPSGKHLVEVQMENRPTTTVNIEIGSDKTYIFNVAGAAVIVYEETMYSEKPDPDLELPYVLHVGETFFKLKKADHLFSEFPEKIMLYGESKKIQSRIGVIKAEAFSMVPYLQMFDVRPEKILSYIEAHMTINKKNSDLLNQYARLCVAYEAVDRGYDFLGGGLSEQPILIDWHRMYEGMAKYKGETGKLITRYDAMLEKDPENSALLYLRGRITRGFDESFDYYNRSIAGDPKNSFPYFAKAYHLASRGDFVRALELSATASKLNPGSNQMEEMHRELSIAVGSLNEIEKKMQVKLASSPVNLNYLRLLLEIRFAKKDYSEAEMAVMDYIKAVEKEMPEDPLQLELKARLTMAYLKADFDVYIKHAKDIQNEIDRKDFFRIAYLNQGEMAKVESLPGIKKQSNRYDCLLYWLGWQDLGQPKKAAPWLKKAREGFRLSKEEDHIVDQWLVKPGPEIAKRLLNLPEHYKFKPILYTAFARLCPGERRKLLAMAEKLNFYNNPPYHFLNKMIKGMKN